MIHTYAWLLHKYGTSSNIQIDLSHHGRVKIYANKRASDLPRSEQAPYMDKSMNEFFGWYANEVADYLLDEKAQTTSLS